MGLFQSEETFKEKVDSNNNWNTDQFILRIVIRIYNRNIEFCVCVCVCVDGEGGGRHLSFYPKDICSFSVLFSQMKRS